MTHKFFAITALSATMLAGFAHAEDVGSKTYTFDIGIDISETLSVDVIDSNGQKIDIQNNYQYTYANTPSHINGFFINGPSLSTTIMKNHTISSNSSNSAFSLSFINSIPMTIDEGAGAKECTSPESGTKCGNYHLTGISSVTQDIIGQLAPLNEVKQNWAPGLNFPGFTIVHAFAQGTGNFPTAQYYEQWQLVITPAL